VSVSRQRVMSKHRKVRFFRLRPSSCYCCYGN